MQDAGNPRPGATDQWAAWLAERRHGADPEYLRQTLEFLAPMRDLVIANAKIVPGSQVLDVGWSNCQMLWTDHGGQAATDPFSVLSFSVSVVLLSCNLPSR